MDPLGHSKFLKSLPSRPWHLAATPAGITTDFQGTVAAKIIVTTFDGIAMYNGWEIMVLVFMTFKHYRGSYFWSLLIAGFGLTPYFIGNVLHDLDIVTTPNAIEGAVTAIIIGWMMMVTGQLFVLWSRLGLLAVGKTGQKLKKITLWMIVVGSIVLYIPTTVLAWGADINVNSSFVDGYDIIEKIQVSGFFFMEATLSTIYIVLAVRYLKTSLSPNSRTVMYQLIAINVIILLFDIGTLVLEAANLFVWQVVFKAFFYSVKLKLEFLILSKLVGVVGRPTMSPGTSHNSRRSSTIPFAMSPDDEKSRRTSRSGLSRSSNSRETTEDISDFVDVEKIAGDYTRAVPFATPKSCQRRTGLHDDFTASDTDLMIAPKGTVTFTETLQSERHIEERCMERTGGQSPKTGEVAS